MLFNQSELDVEIKTLQSLILEKRIDFHNAIRADVEFTELKNQYLKIKNLDKKLDLFLQESNAIKENG